MIHITSNIDLIFIISVFLADVVKCPVQTKSVYYHNFLTYGSKVSWGNECLFLIHTKAPYGLVMTLKKKKYSTQKAFQCYNVKAVESVKYSKENTFIILPLSVLWLRWRP